MGAQDSLSFLVSCGAQGNFFVALAKRGRMKCYKRGRGTSIQEQSQCSRFHLDVVDMDVDVVVAVAVTVHEKVLWMWPSLYRAVSDSLAC